MILFEEVQLELCETSQVTLKPFFCLYPNHKPSSVLTNTTFSKGAYLLRFLK